MIFIILFCIIPVLGHVFAYLITSKDQKMRVLSIFLILSSSLLLWYIYDWYFFFIMPLVTAGYWYGLMIEKNLVK